jgi:hypothetical protein
LRRKCDTFTVVSRREASITKRAVWRSWLGALLIWAIVIVPDAAADQVFSRQMICQTITDAAAATGLPASFLARLLWTESGFRSSVISPTGAIGIAQFMPQTAAERGLADPRDPLEAIYKSARLLLELDQHFGNLGLAAAAYNAGAARVTKWLQGQTGLSLETEVYVLAITGRRAEDWATMRDTLITASSFSLPGLDCLDLGTAQMSHPGPVARLDGWRLRLDSHLAGAIKLSTEPLHADLREPPSSNISLHAQTLSLCKAFRASGIACQVFGY